MQIVDIRNGEWQMMAFNDSMFGFSNLGTQISLAIQSKYNKKSLAIRGVFDRISLEKLFLQLMDQRVPVIEEALCINVISIGNMSVGQRKIITRLLLTLGNIEEALRPNGHGKHLFHVEQHRFPQNHPLDGVWYNPVQNSLHLWTADDQNAGHNDALTDGSSGGAGRGFRDRIAPKRPGVIS
jgi:hypothetical protein